MAIQGNTPAGGEHKLEALERDIARLRLRATDRQYMIDALVPMLGPKARKVWQQWQDQGVQRIHTDWQDDVMALSGEEVAERHLRINEACNVTTPYSERGQ